MAESTLSITLDDLRYEVAAYYSYGGEFGTAFGSLTAPQQAAVTATIKEGLRRFYDPDVVDADGIRHVWSFLSKVAYLDFNPMSAPTDTVTVADGVATMSGGTLATWIAGGVARFNGAGPYYQVASRDGATQFTLEDLTVDVDAGSSVAFYDHVRALPDDFGAIDGTITGPGISLMQVSEERIRVLSAREGAAGTPEVFAFRRRTWPSSGATGQRSELMVYPFVTSALSLEYVYTIQPGTLSSGTDVPLGGMNHGRTILASCLAVAESRIQSKREAFKAAEFAKALAASISFDRQNGGDGANLGYNGDSSDDVGRTSPRRASASPGTYTPGPYPS